MRLKVLLMQLLMGMSMRRYLPAIGTAGLLRSMVSGYNRVPRPPPRIKLSTRCMVVVPRLVWVLSRTWYQAACGLATRRQIVRHALGNNRRPLRAIVERHAVIGIARDEQSRMRRHTLF